MTVTAQSGSALAVLRGPNFRRYISGQALSLIGTWVETVAQALLVLRLTDSGTVLGLATSARYLPVLLLSPYAGVLVDRYRTRNLLISTEAGLGFISALLGLTVLTGHVALWQIFTLATAFGVLSAVDNPARQSFVGQLVPRPQLRYAVTLNSTSVNVARVIGPTIAAGLVTTVGIGWCFVVNALSFTLVIASLVSIRPESLIAHRRSRGKGGQLRAGLVYARSIPEVARPLAMMAVVGTLTFEFEVSLPLLARRTFHGDETAYSWLVVGLGAGAVVGGLSCARWAGTGVHRLVLAATGYGIAMGLLACAPTFISAIFAASLVGLASVVFLTTGNSTIQLASDPRYVGRVTALWSTALVGSTAIGAPVVGLIANQLGPRPALVVGAVACATAVVIGSRPGRATPTPASTRAGREVRR